MLKASRSMESNYLARSQSRASYSYSDGSSPGENLDDVAGSPQGTPSDSSDVAGAPSIPHEPFPAKGNRQPSFPSPHIPSEPSATHPTAEPSGHYARSPEPFELHYPSRDSGAPDAFQSTSQISPVPLRHRPEIEARPRGRVVPKPRPPPRPPGGYPTYVKPHPRLVVEGLEVLSTSASSLKVQTRLDIRDLGILHELDQHNMRLRQSFRIEERRGLKRPPLQRADSDENRVFGVALDQSSFHAWEPLRVGGCEFELPIVVVACIEALSTDALYDPNLFKSLPDPIRLRELVDIFNDPHSSDDARPAHFGANTSLACDSVADICALLSTYMMSLPEPLIPLPIADVLWKWCVDHESGKSHHNLHHQSFSHHLYPSHHAKGSSSNPQVDRARQVRIAQLVLHLLPTPNYFLFVYLLSFLNQLVNVQKAIRGKAKAGGSMSVEAIAEMSYEWIFGSAGRNQDGGRWKKARELDARNRELFLWILVHGNSISAGLLEVSDYLQKSFGDGIPGGHGSFGAGKRRELDKSYFPPQPSPPRFRSPLRRPSPHSGDIVDQRRDIRGLHSRPSIASIASSVYSTASGDTVQVRDATPVSGHRRPMPDSTSPHRGRAIEADHRPIRDASVDTTGPQTSVPLSTVDTAPSIALPSQDSGVAAHADAVVSIMRNLVDGVKDLQVEITKAEEKVEVNRDGGDQTAPGGQRPETRETVKLGLSQLARSLQDIGPVVEDDQSAVRSGSMSGTASTTAVANTPETASTVTLANSSSRPPSRPLPVPPISQTSVATMMSTSSSMDLNERLMAMSMSSSSFAASDPLSALFKTESAAIVDAAKASPQLAHAPAPPMQHPRSRETKVVSVSEELYDALVQGSVSSSSPSSSRTKKNMPNPTRVPSGPRTPKAVQESKASSPNIPVITVTPLVPKASPPARTLRVSRSRPRSIARDSSSSLEMVQEEEEEGDEDSEDRSRLEKELQKLKAQNILAFDALEESNRQIARLESKLNSAALKEGGGSGRERGIRVKRK
ncbi:hypothetical protein CC2G_008341 [Coprinopsis cinerea AmutBmut pab1-1]|nr:hypothetical protein CC2G_008341 [Coprinopsis cinerea AmutBmut pab1-1]